MEREYGFEEEFKSDIKIKAEEHLEGYELKEHIKMKMNTGCITV